MDKLEQYLDQVCRRIGGPRALRQHVRQELREHLLDAAAQHKAAGLPEEEAVAQALADFGQPEDVRSELEDAHGHRVMAVVIDKALNWKEKTMRAKWLWATWAHLALANLTSLLRQLLDIFPRGSYVLEDQLVWDPSRLNIRLLDSLPVCLVGTSRPASTLRDVPAAVPQ